MADKDASKDAETSKAAGTTTVVEEELVLDEKELNEISDKVGASLLPQLQQKLDEGLKSTESTTKKAVEEAIAKMEPVVKKGVGNGDGDGNDEEDADDPVTKGIENGTIDKSIAEMTPAMRFYRQMRALSNENMEELAKINKYTLASQLRARKAVEKKGQEAVAKAGYANETTAADGSVLVPDAEFVTTVFDNLPNYGVVFREGDVRQTDRTSVRVISLDSGLTFYATAEAGVKTSAKLAFSKNEVSLSKYAVIVPATDELTDDAAIDYWNLVTRELTRAYGFTADTIAFTHATSGITNQSGVVTHTLGANAAALDWDDLLVAQSKTEDDLDTSNFKWYMRKETWYALIMKKGTTNDHYIAGSLSPGAGWVANPNTPMTPWGTPVVFTRVLPTINAVSANDAIAVYGDLRNYILYNKRGMQIKMLSEATILDSEGTTFNLATQDAQAMRAVVRLLGILPKGNRTKFVILGTGTVS